jgi:hypothetical protein
MKTRDKALIAVVSIGIMVILAYLMTIALIQAPGAVR